MSNDWLKQLHQLHEVDKAKHQLKVKPKEQQQTKLNQAADLLRQSKAHKLLRQVQKTLLKGRGSLDIFDAVDRHDHYDRVITLAWQGPISAARKPNPDDPEDYRYILVGVRQGKLWVNGKSLSSTSPEALKAALLQASKNPGREKQGQ